MIQFEKYDYEVPVFLNSDTKRWIEEVLSVFHKRTGLISFLFCSDESLLRINKQFLDHDFYTDIITFNKSLNVDVISGECYISVERVMENAGILKESYVQELHRVIIHGMLHLIGFNDASSEQKQQMRILEQKCLNLRLST